MQWGKKKQWYNKLKIQRQKSYWQVHRLCCQVTIKVMFGADLKLAMYILSLLGVLVRRSFTNQMPGLTSWVLFKSLWSMSLCWGAWPQRDKKECCIHYSWAWNRGQGVILYVFLSFTDIQSTAKTVATCR